MRRLVLGFVNSLGRSILQRHRPTVVAVTGSVGKTTTKDAIFTAVSGQKRALRALGSLNAEWGVFLSLVGYEKTSGAYARLTVLELLGAIIKGLRIRFGSKYVEVVIIEVGADRPGDVAYLMEYYHPDVAVITNVGASHLAQFSSVEAIADEKWGIVQGLREGGRAVLNGDDARLRARARGPRGRFIWYGTGDCELVASEIQSRPEGVSYILRTKEGERRVDLKVRGDAGVYASLAALGVVSALGLDLDRAVEALRELRPPKGRLNVFHGNGFTIIDDTYNASPDSMRVALEYLSTFPGRKVAILGEMRELGELSGEGHRAVGELAGRTVDRLLVVGEAARGILETANSTSSGQAGERGRFFPDVETLVAAFPEELKPGDTILVKASRGVYLERVVDSLLGEPIREKIGGDA